jgi:hypothetical protein
MEEIVNRVQSSKLISLDLADFKPAIVLIGIDIAEQLWQGLVLREKEFRAWINGHDWMMYKDKAVFIYCSADAIVPTWAYMLVSAQLVGVATDCVVGTELDLEKRLIKSAITQIDLEPFKDGKIIIKGCADIACPEYAMVELITRLQPIAKSIMYGEPCSTVPVFKKK